MKEDETCPIRIGLIGCGRIAEFGYLPALRQAKGLKLTCVADINLWRCKEIAPGIPAYKSASDLIAAGNVDALVISTPTRFHLAAARCAATARLPALVEKPPGLNVSEASALRTLNPPPWLAFNRRFEPGLAHLKMRVPRDGRFQMRLELHYRRNTWKSFDMQDDVLLDLGPHLIDLARWLTNNEILWARARMLHERRVEFELMLEQGAATILCSNKYPHYEYVELKDDLGEVRGSYKRGGLFAGIVAKFQPHLENPLVNSLVAQLHAFGCVIRGRLCESPLATPTDGLAVMSTIEALRQSAIKGGVPSPVNFSPR